MKHGFRYYADFVFGAMLMGGFALFFHHLAYHDIPMHWAFWDHGTIGTLVWAAGSTYFVVRIVRYLGWMRRKND